MNLFENLQMVKESNNYNVYVWDLEVCDKVSNKKIKADERKYNVGLDYDFDSEYYSVTVSGDVDDVIKWLSCEYFDCGISDLCEYIEDDIIDEELVQIWNKKHPGMDFYEFCCENLQMVKESNLKTMTDQDRTGYQGVNNFPNGNEPMIADGKCGLLVIGGADGEPDMTIVSLYYGPDSDRWAWKLYDNQDEAIKDANLFTKLLDDEIDTIQLKRFGFNA